MIIRKLRIILIVLGGLYPISLLVAQYGPINPFVMPEPVFLNWYGSGDINNDKAINWSDLSRLDSIMSGLYSYQGDVRLHDRADIDGNQNISMSDRTLLEEFLEGERNYLPAHWNRLTTTEERIDWLEKVIAIDRTEEGMSSPTYIGDYYADQLLVNTHGFGEDVLSMFPGGIDDQHNGRFNLPLSYAGVSYNRPDLTMNRNLLAIVIGDNVFDWNDWCFIDPQWDQLIFPADDSEPTGNESFPPLNSWLDDINNITHRDTVAPFIELSIGSDKVILDNGYFDLGYTLTDPNLREAFYCIDGPTENQIVFRDSLFLNVAGDRLIPGYDTSGTLNLLLKNGQYDISFEARDHFDNSTNKTLQVVVNDPPPIISIISPIEDSTYTQEIPQLHYFIEERDFGKAWYSLDSGQTYIEIQQEGDFLLDLEDGNHQLIVIANDVFGNTGRDTVSFAINKQTPAAKFGKDEELELLVYPNPVIDMLNILVHHDSSSSIRFDIHDINGRLIWTYSEESSTALNNKIEVDVSDYPAGVYLIKLTFYDETTITRRIMEKIIKQ